MGRNLGLLLGTSALFAMAVGMLPPLLVPIQEDLQLSTLQIGAINSVFGLARMVIDIPTGHYLRRASAMTALVAAILLSVGGSLIVGLAAGYRTVLTGRSLAGLGTGIAYVVIMTQLLRESPAGARGQTTSLYDATRTLSMGVGSLLAGYLGDAVGWRGAFFGAAILSCLALMPASAWALRHRSGRVPSPASPDAPAPLALRQTNPQAEERSALAHVSGVLPLYTLSFLLAFCWGGVLLTLFPLYGGTSLKLSAHTVGWALTLSYVANVLLLVPVGWWSDRIGHLLVLGSGSGVLALAILLIPLSTGSTPFLTVGVVLGVGFSVWAQPPTILVARATAFHTSSLVGSYRFVTDLGYVVGPLLLTLLATHLGFGVSLSLTALAVVLTIAVVVLTARR